VVVDDVGTVINPLLLKGQIHGALFRASAVFFLKNAVTTWTATS